MINETIFWQSANGVQTPVDELEHAHAFNILVGLDVKAKEGNAPWIKKSSIYK